MVCFSLANESKSTRESVAVTFFYPLLDREKPKTMEKSSLILDSK